LWIKLWYTSHRWSFCFSTSICWIHCIYRSTKLFTLLLKSNFFYFETLSRVHVYRIEYVLYLRGPYRIRIVSAADRIVPALVKITKWWMVFLCFPVVNCWIWNVEYCIKQIHVCFLMYLNRWCMIMLIVMYNHVNHYKTQ